VIEPESPLFPNAVTEKPVYDIIGICGLDISIYKADNLKAFDSFPVRKIKIFRL